VGRRDDVKPKGLAKTPTKMIVRAEADRIIETLGEMLRTARGRVCAFARAVEAVPCGHPRRRTQ